MHSDRIIFTAALLLAVVIWCSFATTQETIAGHPIVVRYYAESLRSGERLVADECAMNPRLHHTFRSGTHMCSPQTQERPRLVHADSLIGIVEDGEEVMKLKGDVRFIQGDASMTCEEARWWEDKQRMRMVGDVFIHDGEHTLYAQRVDYDGLRREESAYDDVLLIAGNRRVRSDFLHYEQKTRIAVARDDVIITDLIERATLFGMWAKYDRQSDYGVIKGNPRLVKEDSLSADMLSVEGVCIEVWGEGQRVVVTDSVQFVKGDMSAACSRAEYFSGDSLLVLEQIPVVWYRDQKITGDTITLRLDGITFRRSHIRGNARIVTLDSTDRDILEGGTIVIDAAYTDKDTIQTITVEDQASSRYHIREKDEDQEGVNVVTGDRLVLVIIGDRLRSVEVVSSPGESTGVYTPKGVEENPKTENRERRDSESGNGRNPK